MTMENGLIRKRSVMLSVHPQWCEKIINGEKTLEIRKTIPNLKSPFKVYLYCTKGKQGEGLIVGREGATLVTCSNYHLAIPVGGHIGNGRVVGEFRCDRVYMYSAISHDDIINISDEEIVRRSCLSIEEIRKYEDRGNTQDSKFWHYGVFAWNINHVIPYNIPYRVRAFRHAGSTEQLIRPPQSWCYVEDEGAYLKA